MNHNINELESCDHMMYCSDIHVSLDKVDLEILISTTYKKDFSFLDTLFHKEDTYENYNLLIVNQTDENHLLFSDMPNVRVINSFDKGTTKSRNLAIKNSIGQLCLIADDDTTYVKNLKNIICDAYDNNEACDFITFRALDEDNRLYTKYPHKGIQNRSSLRSIYSWVITFKRMRLKKSNLLFDEDFGINAVFHPGEEFVFLRDAHAMGMKIFHQPQIIVSHPNKTSGKNQGEDQVVFSRAAIQYRYNGVLAYLWLIKYVLFLYRKNYIYITEILHKISQGFKGIRKYKELESSVKM